MAWNLVLRLEYLDSRRWKSRYPTVINFESIPACDERTDTPPIAKSRSSMAERDKNGQTYIVHVDYNWPPRSMGTYRFRHGPGTGTGGQ